MLENLTNQDIIVLTSLISLIIIVGIICIALTVKKDKTKKEDKSVIDKAQPDINMALATSNIPEISDEEPILDDLLNDEKQENDETIKELDEKVEEEQDEKNRSTIEEVLKAMNEDLEKEKYETIDKYEEEQEENAVISYQELVARKMALADDEQEEKHVDEVITKTSYIQDENGVTPVSFQKIQLTDQEETPQKSTSKFSNSEFISPVFGRLDNTMEYPTLKKTVETTTFTQTKVGEDNLSEETDEFLNTLKEFRKNL